MRTIEKRIRKYDEFGVVQYNLSYVFAVILSIAVCIALIAANLVFSFEQGAEGTNISSFGDAFWTVWMAMSTIGFGDHYPITIGGRVVIGTMFAVGALLIGLNIGIASHWITSKFDKTIPNRALKMQNDSILQKLDRLETELNIDQTVRFGKDEHNLDEVIDQFYDSNSHTAMFVTLGKDDCGRFVIVTNTKSVNDKPTLKWVSFLIKDDAFAYFIDQRGALR